MKNHNYSYRIILFSVTAIAALSLGSCANEDLNTNEAHVRIQILGAGTADNVIEVSLPVEVGGTEYFFEVTGYADIGSADFTLDITRVGEVEPVHSVSFSLPLEDVNNAEPGESGYGDQYVLIYSGANSVYIDFEWTTTPPLDGDADVSLTFHHPPRIIVWSVIPGPGVPAGTDILVQAEVEFYGDDDGWDPTVTAQFWDEDSASWWGERVDLSFYSTTGLWTGTITAEAGSESLWLVATDEDGSTSSDVDFPVAY